MTEQITMPLDIKARIRLIQESEDFPALTNTISEINNVVSSDTSSIQTLSSIILEDFSLTNNLLKVVNTVSYGQFGGKISTISKAVVILGFDVVRNIATALIVLDFLQNKSQSDQIRDKVISAYFIGITSRQLTINQQASNYEEAMICGIFHQLGHLLSLFYFFDETQAVNQLIADGMSEAKASETVLGVSYDVLGTEVAKIWQLPQNILIGMQTTESLKGTRFKPNKLNLTVNLASELTTIAASNHKKDKHQSIQKLVDKYKKSLPVDVASLQQALEDSLNEVSARGNIIKLAAKKSTWLKSVTEYTNGSLLSQSHHHDNSQKEKVNSDKKVEQPNHIASNESNDILQAGIQEVINSIVGEYQLNDVLQMILETMYRGLACDRVFLFIRDSKTKTMQAKSGYGHAIQNDIPAFRFSVDFTPDVFHLSIEKGVDIVIEDTHAAPIASKIPAWYKKVSSARSFLLLPIMINNKAVGCFYADMMDTHGFDEASKSLSLLRTLRNQAVLAIKQSYG